MAGMKTSACAARAVREWVAHRDEERKRPPRALTKKQREEMERQQDAHRQWYSLAGERPPDAH